MKSITVCSYNIHKGFSLSGRKFVLRELRQALHKLGAEVVFLQEIIGTHSRHARRVAEWPELPQIQYLAHEVWPHAAYGKNCIYSEGHHGNAILSQYRIRSWTNLDVSAHPLEQRGILHCWVDIPKYRPDLHCFCLHFGLTRRGRDRQLEQLVEFVSERAGAEAPVIVAGDFNDWSERATALLERELGVREVFYASFGDHAKSYPAVLPILKLDRIYFRGLKLLDAQVLEGAPWKQLSDHAPLVARFGIEE